MPYVQVDICFFFIGNLFQLSSAGHGAGHGDGHGEDHDDGHGDGHRRKRASQDDGYGGGHGDSHDEGHGGGGHHGAENNYGWEPPLYLQGSLSLSEVAKSSLIFLEEKVRN